MAVLHLENVPADLMKRIERLAEQDRQTPEATVIHLLEKALPRDPSDQRKNVRKILDRIRRNPIVPVPGTPDSYALLREDRNRGRRRLSALSMPAWP